MQKRLVFVVLALSLAACGSLENPAVPRPTRGLLEVLGVEVANLESYPPQAVAQIEGQLPTVCTAIDAIHVRRLDRVVEEACIAVAPPPVKVPVNLGYFVETGEYVLRVNGFERRFSI